MPPDMEDFRQRILAHAKLVAARAPKVLNEATTNASLVQPFLAVLGYDVGNPDEVSPEHHADFSEKYQNKVDYAILHNALPVIALESKRYGAPIKDDRGQLRSYFNACPTVKLGVLTDGMRYEFYADSDKPNMMDEVAFLRFDFSEIAKNNAIDDNTLSGIAAIRSGLFNPSDVGAEAKRKLLFDSIVETIRQFKNEPSDDFIRFVLTSSTVTGKITKMTSKIIEANREVIRSAMEAFVAQEALSRFGYAPRDVVRTPVPEVVAPVPTVPTVEAETELLPTPNEVAALANIKSRLYYLVHNDILFKEVSKLAFKKTRATFRIYYQKPNSGSLCDYREGRDGKAALHFAPLGIGEVKFESGPELDESLLKAFVHRVTESGIVVEPGQGPALRTIIGGQAAG